MASLGGKGLNTSVGSARPGPLINQVTKGGKEGGEGGREQRERGKGGGGREGGREEVIPGACSTPPAMI